MDVLDAQGELAQVLMRRLCVGIALIDLDPNGGTGT